MDISIYSGETQREKEERERTSYPPPPSLQYVDINSADQRNSTTHYGRSIWTQLCQVDVTTDTCRPLWDTCRPDLDSGDSDHCLRSLSDVLVACSQSRQRHAYSVIDALRGLRPLPPTEPEWGREGQGHDLSVT